MTVSAQPVLVSGRLCLELAVTRHGIRADSAEERVYWQHGGNGGHMAVTARRLGAPVALCAHAGYTAHDDDIVATLAGEGIDVSGVVRRRTHRSPAHLHTDRSFDSQPVTVSSPVEPTLMPEDVDRIEALLLDHAWLLIDGSLPHAFLVELIDRAALYSLHIVMCVTQAPPATIPRRVWEHVDFIVSNVSTVALFSRRGLWPAGARDDPSLILRRMPRLRGVVVLRGAQELLWADHTQSQHMALGVQAPVHVRGAGAVAAAALTVALAEQRDLADAVLLARETVAFYICHEGTRPAMPLRKELPSHVAG